MGVFVFQSNVSHSGIRLSSSDQTFQLSNFQGINLILRFVFQEIDDGQKINFALIIRHIIVANFGKLQGFIVCNGNVPGGLIHHMHLVALFD